MASKFEITIDARDLKEAARTFKAMEKQPVRLVTQAARRGATVVKNAVKSSSAIPVRTGLLRSGIKLSRVEKVYEVRFDPDLNDEFQRKDRPIKRRGLLGGKSDHPYYPASMEYGYLANDGHGGVMFRPGHHFMAKTGEAMREPVKAEMAKKFIDAVEKEWTKRHGT